MSTNCIDTKNYEGIRTVFTEARRLKRLKNIRNYANLVLSKESKKPLRNRILFMKTWMVLVVELAIAENLRLTQE